MGRRLMPTFPFSQHRLHPSAPFLSVGTRIHWTSTHWGEKEMFQTDRKARGQQPEEGHPDLILNPNITFATVGTNTMLAGMRSAG